MTTKWKVVIAVGVVAVLAGGVAWSAKLSQRGVVTVQTGKVLREDIVSTVAASGEIKPRNYINIGANAQGELKEILVKEGDRVKKGQLLALVENTQPTAAMNEQQAALASSEADANASEAAVTAAKDNLLTMQATIDHSKADMEKAKVDFERYKQLYADKLVAQQEFDQRKSTYDAAVAAVRESEARLVQAKTQVAQAVAQLAGSQRRIAQSKAGLSRVADVLKKFNSYSPLDGVVTNLPMRVGETVVPGIQSSTSSTIMTIADMSLITAEVKVDETDIINVKLGQVAEVTIDALPAKTFIGHVIEIGNTAILRSTGVAASQSQVSSQEAKDFKVVIGLDNPPDDIRPGLSCASKITTATEKNSLAIPIQSIQVRTKGDLEDKPKDGAVPVSTAKVDPAVEKARKEEVQGVFVISGGKAHFKIVKTGITGTTDTQVVSGLNEGDEIVTGPYQMLRSLRNEASVKVDNKPPVIKPAS